jgi:hypothetical protein
LIYPVRSTGWDYWSYGPGAVHNTKDWVGQKVLPLQSFALDGALAEWGMVSQAQARIDYYLTHFIKSDGQVLYPASKHNAVFYSKHAG